MPAIPPPRRAPRGPRHSRRFRLPRTDAGQRDRAGGQAELGPACSRRARTRRSTHPSSPSACRTDRWAIPKSATSTSAPVASSTRITRASITRSRPASSRATRRCWAPSRRPAPTARRCTCSASSRRAASTATSGRSRPWSSWRRRVARRASACTRSWTAATRRRKAPARRSPSLQEVCARHPDARIASIVGRYYAMDRDQRWERLAEAYDLLVDGRAPHTARIGAGGSRRRLCARRDRRVRSRDGDRRTRRRANARSPTATSSCS